MSQYEDKCDFNVKVSFESGMLANITFDNEVIVEDFHNDMTVKVLMLGDTDSVQNYELLSNKPSIEGVPLVGNQTFAALTLTRMTNSEIQEILDG